MFVLMPSLAEDTATQLTLSLTSTELTRLPLTVHSVRSLRSPPVRSDATTMSP